MYVRQLRVNVNCKREGLSPKAPNLILIDWFPRGVDLSAINGCTRVLNVKIYTRLFASWSVQNWEK